MVSADPPLQSLTGDGRSARIGAPGRSIRVDDWYKDQSTWVPGPRCEVKLLCTGCSPT